MANSTTEKIYALAANPANKKLASDLEASGGKVVLYPQIATEKLPSDEETERLLDNLQDFDWLIFLDIFAADYFLQAFEANGRDFYELDGARICTLGEAVADRLRFVQVHADVVPNSVEQNAVVKSLVAYIGSAEIARKRFLIVKRDSASALEITSALQEKNAFIRELEIYSADISGAAGENSRLKALFAGGAIDEFVFTSPADFIALEELVARPTLAEILRESKISATDEVTLQFLREHSLNAAPFRRK